MQLMPHGLSDMDHRIWENINHAALWEILLARICEMCFEVFKIILILFTTEAGAWAPGTPPGSAACDSYIHSCFMFEFDKFVQKLQPRSSSECPNFKTAARRNT